MILQPFKKFLRLLILLVIIISLAAVSYFKLLDGYELGFLDLRFVFRCPKIPTTDKIALVEIGEDSIKKLGRFPFDRSYHAHLIKALSEAGAKVILIDLLFSEPQESDNQLEFALNQAGNVYLPYVFEIERTKGARILSVKGTLAKSLDNLVKETRGQGHINIIPDPDGKFRRIPLFIKYSGALHPHISFQIACDYLGIKDTAFLKIPIDEDGNRLVNFSGKWGSSYRHYSYVDVLQSYLARATGGTPVINLDEFKDKICIVGLTATGSGDTHPTPLEPICPGMNIHAEVINSVLQKNYVSRASRGVNLAVFMLLGLLISIITLKTKPFKALFGVISSLFIFACTAVLLFNYFGIWIDMAYPIGASFLLYLAVTIYKYVVEWKNRLIMENELGIARKIQESFLPKTIPNVEGVDIAACMFTAKAVGGDLYDFVELGDKKFGVMIGDVSGKGVPASLFMAMVTGAFKTFARAEDNAPRGVLKRLNTKLVEESSSNLFVTMFYSIYDMARKTCTYSNGGHLPLAYASADGAVKFLDVEEGTPLALMDSEYSQKELNFKPGDIFVFYTDGITEAMNSRSELYGKERLEKMIKQTTAFPAAEILKAIEKDVRRFEPIAKQHDDMTVIVVKI